MTEPSAPRRTFVWTAVLVAGALSTIALVHAVNRSWKGVFSGDEPHYLMVVNSLLFDHDLDLSDDYRRVAHGGWEAGARFRGVPLDHHTVLVDPASGRSLLWQEVFDWRRHECNGPDCEGYRRLTQDFLPGQPRQEVSAHSVIYPAFLALLAAPFRPALSQVETTTNGIVQWLCVLGVFFTYFAARSSGHTRFRALVAAVLLGAASPWLAYSRSYFVELPAGVALIAGFLALRRGRPIAAGLAAGIAFALKPPFALFALGWALERLWARKPREAIALAAPFGAVTLAVAIFNQLTAKRWVVSGTSPWAWAMGLNGVHANLFDAAHGLLPFAPWALAAIVALAISLARPDPASEPSRQIALPTALYFALIASNAYLGETCYGPRYWVAVLPLLAIAAADLPRVLPAPRWVCAGLVVLGILGAYVAVPGAYGYPHLWDQPALAPWTPRR